MLSSRHAYGLDRAQYERVLASFSHKSFPAAPVLCLAAFDELGRVGLTQFCRDRDPYYDIPLVTSSPTQSSICPMHQPLRAVCYPGQSGELIPLSLRKAKRRGNLGHSALPARDCLSLRSQ